MTEEQSDVESYSDEHLEHYGILRRSGRYPWGSGGDKYSRSMTFMDHIESMKKDGLNDTSIARGLGMTTTEFRATKTIARNEIKQSNIAFAQSLKDKGYSNTAIGERMGRNESSVRAMLAPGEKAKADILLDTADYLREQADTKKFVDIGMGNEAHLNVSSTRMKAAVAVLEAEGYSVNTVKVPQVTTGNKTTLKVLSPPGVTQKEVFLNQDKIQFLTAPVETGRSKLGIFPPIQIAPKRIDVKWKEDGGADEDGVIYVRPGTKDLGMGAANYAQVRISVGKGHYMKGMAIYKDDLPDGVDIQFNTNKPRSTNKLDALKKISDDPDNPYGAVISQLTSTDGKGNTRVTSALNIVNQEGDWGNWSKSISSQVLSKQNPSLAREQLKQVADKKKKEFDEIMTLTNPVVKKKLLEKLADDADSSAVHLKAAALKGQSTHVILPSVKLPETQVYAPNFPNGTRVALIRFPHAGKFEIPELTVNNNHSFSKRLLKNAKDAIGINPKVAERLSGADFDGDTVLVIPNGSGKIKSAKALAGLKNFDPKTAYPGYEGMPKMSSREKGIQMGLVSNLITDMTIQKATPAELARAVRHSMVVIDAEKHDLNWKLSAQKNGISDLSRKYQNNKPQGGASTLISRAGSVKHIPEREKRKASQGGPIDPKTGEVVYSPTNRMRTTQDGSKVPVNSKVKKLALTNDAYSLSSGSAIESVYASHSNTLKALANKARLESIKQPGIKYSPQAAKTYSSEVKSLNAKLDLVNRNRPLERQAQIIATTSFRTKKSEQPDMDKAQEKKLRYQSLEAARLRTGAAKNTVVITEKEWVAVQSGAISTKKLSDLLNAADMDNVRTLATPRKPKTPMNSSEVARARAMFLNGATRAEVAAALGISLNALDEGMK